MNQTNSVSKKASNEVITIKPGGTTLLNSLDSEGKGASVHRACLSGYCGSCRTVLLDGQVEYLDEPLACLSENEILPCYCKAVTDVTIKL